MSKMRDILEKWLEDNPDGWKNTDKFIAEKTGVSYGSTSRHVPEIIARRDGIMPSDVQELRRKERKISRRPKADPNKIRKIIADNPNAPVCDLAFLAGCSQGTIRRTLKDIKREQEDNRADNSDEIRDIKAQLDRLQSEFDQFQSQFQSEFDQLQTRLSQLLGA